MTEPVYRRAARILVTDPARRLLLFLVEAPTGLRVWITPGGGLEDGETWERAGARELLEEVGIETADLGPPVWTRRHVFRWGEKSLDQDERYFWIADVRPDLKPPPPTEFEPWIEARWWTTDEIREAAPHLGAETDGGHLFAPRRLADLLDALFEQGRPQEPLDTGV